MLFSLGCHLKFQQRHQIERANNYIDSNALESIRKKKLREQNEMVTPKPEIIKQKPGKYLKS